MKKILLSLALLCGIGHAATAQTYNRYDVNHDGRVSIDDATWVINHLLGHVNVKIQEISFAQPTVTLSVGDTKKLAYTIAPADADLKTLKWTSTPKRVAIVESDGTVKAQMEGTATILAVSMDGSEVFATCQVVVKNIVDESGTDANGRQYVDMGLSVKWATCNVGASSPEDLGSHYAWAETYTKHVYDWSTYFDYASGSFDRYNTSSNGLKVIAPDDDVAHTLWKDSWRMPTIEEWEQLFSSENCSWKWDAVKNGYLVTSKKTNNSIFLPAAGHHVADMFSYDGSEGHYWSSSLRTDLQTRGWEVLLNSTQYRRLSAERYYGYSIRPVRP